SQLWSPAVCDAVWIVNYPSTVRILWVHNGMLLPANAGGRIRTVFTLRELARRHEVNVLSSYRAAAVDTQYEERLQAEFPDAQAVHLGGPWSWGGVARAVRLLSRVPDVVREASSPSLALTVAEHLKSGEFDVAVCDFFESAVNFPQRPEIPVVLFEHNVEWELMRLQSPLAPSLRERIAISIESRRLRALEAGAVSRFVHTVAVSEEDAAALRALAGHSRVTAIPTGVDLATYRPSVIPTTGAPTVAPAPRFSPSRRTPFRSPVR
ncbi:MAG: glycosyltransferase, partial [Anaerolineaceae bacterium]